MKNRETFHQTLAMMTVGLNEFAVAIDDGWLIPSLFMLKNPNEEFLLTSEQSEWSYLLDKYIGRIIGAVMAAILLDRVGRKSLLSICATTFCLIWMLTLFAKSVWIFYLARIAFGVARGINDVTNAIYLGEISSPSIRGIFGTIIKIMYSLGYLIGFISVTFLYLKIAALINFFITLLSLISVFWMVEPVQYSLMKSEYDQAEKNFIWLKGDANLDEIADEFQEIKQNVYAEKFKKLSFIKIFTYKANYKSLLIILTISLFFGFINYHVVTLTHLLYFTTNTSTFTWNNIIILLGITRFLVLVSTPFIIRIFKRRSMIMISFSLISVPLLLIAALISIKDMGILTYPVQTMYIHISVVFFCSIFEVALTTLFLLRSELFPLSIKALGGSLSIIGYTLGRYSMICLLLVQQLQFIFILLSGLVVILVLFLYYIKLPETGNQSLIEIQGELEGSSVQTVTILPIFF